MVSEPLLNPADGFLRSFWLSAFVPILAVPMNHIFLFPKGLRDYAIGVSLMGRCLFFLIKEPHFSAHVLRWQPRCARRGPIVAIVENFKLLAVQWVKGMGDRENSFR
jgi:hypothetical protein